MPFISIPKSRVRKNNKTFVMEDPGVKRDALAPALTEPLDTSEPKMEERVPASEPDNSLSPPEPDAFDTPSAESAN